MSTPTKQAVDVTRPHTLLTLDVKRSGSLIYRYEDTKEEVSVPNVWTNQPYSCRVAYIRYQALAEEERAARFAKNPQPFDLSPEAIANQVSKLRDYAKRIRAEADRMESAGLVEYPVAASRMEINYGTLSI